MEEINKFNYSKGMELLVTTVQELSLARDLDTVMTIVRRVARQLTGADGATFILRDGELCYYADEDAISPLWKGSRFPLNNCVSGWAMIHREPAIIPDIYTDDRVPIEAYKPTFVKSMAMVPIRTIEPVGAIGNYWAHKHTPSGDEIKLLQALADITAVTLENVKVYAELEQRVQERTTQLEALNKELEAFSYSVSHDLRAPLRAIKGFTKVLQEEHVAKLDADGKMLTNMVMDNAIEMGKLIEGMLGFFSMGKKELRKSKLDMQEMVNGIIMELQRLEQGREIEFIVKELPAAYADPTLMRQVWMNLLTNAVKYTRKKEHATIEIGYDDKAATPAYYIKDNGAGFNMQYYSKLFGVFQRLHTQEEFEGTGIGLATTERIISKHGGKIWAEAEVGEGAVFYFSLPKG